jgi:hypothetical protein
MGHQFSATQAMGTGAAPRMRPRKKKQEVYQRGERNGGDNFYACSQVELLNCAARVELLNRLQPLSIWSIHRFNKQRFNSF